MNFKITHASNVKKKRAFEVFFYIHFFTHINPTYKHCSRFNTPVSTFLREINLNAAWFLAHLLHEPPKLKIVFQPNWRRAIYSRHSESDTCVVCPSRWRCDTHKGTTDPLLTPHKSLCFSMFFVFADITVFPDCCLDQSKI